MEPSPYSLVPGNLQPPGELQPQALPLTYYAPQPYYAPKDELDLKSFLEVLRRRALIVASVAIAVTATTWGWTWSQTPIYKGDFQVLVEPVTDTPSPQQLLQENQNALQPTFDYATQIEVLRSPGLLAPAVSKLQKLYPDLNYGSLVSNLTITQLSNTKILLVSYRDSDPKKVHTVLESLSDLYLNYGVQQRQVSLQQGTQFVDGQLPKLRKRVSSLQEELEKFRQRYSLIDPESRGNELSELISDVEKQQQEARTQLIEAQSLYGTLQNQVGYRPTEAIAAASLSESPRYQQLLNQIQEVEAQIAVELARFQPTSPNIQILEDKKQQLEALLGEESQKVLGNQARPSGADGNLTSISLDLSKQLVNTANQVQVLQMRNLALAEVERNLKQNFELVPALARQYTDLQRELKVATESLNRFLGTKETLQIEASQKAIPWQVISAPQEPQQPISPNTPRNLALGVVAGLLLGTGAALLTEKLDNVFHSPTDLKDLTRLPLLGVVPFQKRLPEPAYGVVAPRFTLPEQNLAPEFSDQSQLETFNLENAPIASPSHYTTSPFLESFRSLYTNVRLLGSDTPIRSLVVGSAVPAEGKSTISLQLAKAAAAMGQRVLLVDADMRRPQVHTYLGLANMRGLSHLIATNVTAEEVIQRSHSDENLFIITAGQIPPDPTKLLSSKKMQNLMEELQESFDLVIYDTPPVLGLADSSILATYTDGIIMVVGLGKTDRSTLVMALDSLRISSTPVLGIVANGIKGYTTQSYDYYNRYYTQKRDSVPLEVPANLS
ncbi:polysaccharide biosynthesis tyrosine autokinase [Trichocoleus sp. FACHB-591]|uniref:GumC family protein n=1 Tax=Trichocoleus sp. FACHB-591 TaxID=2692872 RepID=UPI001689F422|nr:polysaccharide biosynthesis tyrosine autokinase [Trichocoleus sp. FACHB-591]MBD2093966.1 polysaccharide biosynthesis tyrosine autokinase [Trichocoleus sp. FACHB-591]